MEGFDMRRNKMLNNDESFLNTNLEKTNLEFSVSPYKNSSFVEVSSQVQMITDSLLACLQMSKCRPLRRVSDVSGKAKTQLTSESLSQTQKETHHAGENTVYVSHMLRQDNWYRKFQEWNSVISQEVLIDSNAKTCSFKGLSGIVSQNTLKTLKDQAEDPISMVDIVQGELRTLTSLAPSVSSTAENLSKWVSHYKECTKCHEKISLLEILHRIQELNLYIAKKRKKTHNRSTQSKEKEEKSVHELKQQTSSKSGSIKQVSKKQSRERQVEKSQALDPAAIAEGNPGVQILLEVDPEKKKLYHFSTAKFNDFSYPSAVQEPESSKYRRPSLLSPKLYSCATFFAPTFFARSPDSVLVLNNPIEVYKSVKKTLEKTRKISFINRVELCEKQSIRWTENFCVVFLKKIGCLAVPETLGQEKEDQHSDESSDFISNSLKELHKRMEFRIVDEEVSLLRNLISEVQQSQIKLSKVLLNEGIFSQQLIKLTNPNLLEEESKTLKKISGYGNSYESSTLDDIQDLINSLKEKCSFKNRLICTVTRGLRHNIPKEWWEEIVGYTFEGSNTLNERDFEKVDSLLRQCSSYFRRQEKALGESEEVHEDERPTEGGVLESEEEATTARDTDQESEYMTGLEDLVEPDPLELSEIRSCQEPSSTSSFVQKILYEDACAGVAVMDLFVAIKAVKQNLDVLEERNNDFFDQIHHLNAETKVFMKEYENLRYCITEFLNQMEGDMKLREVMKTSRKRQKSREIQMMKRTNDTANKKCEESKSSEHLSLAESNPKKAPPSLKEKPSYSTTNLPEAMLVSFLAALVCLEKEQKRSSFLASSNQGGKAKQESKKRQELHKPPEGEVSDFPSHKISAVESTNKKTSEGDADVLDTKTGNKAKTTNVVGKSDATDNSTSSDDDDSFKEALSVLDPMTEFPASAEKVSSVTCMGDLKKEMMDKENESLILKADVNSSKIWKLATDICSKVIKTKRKKKEKVLQQHRHSLQESKNTIADSLKFTVSTNSPMGVFDVTVIPHKKRRLLTKKPDSDLSDSDVTSSYGLTEDSLSSTQIHSSSQSAEISVPTNYELLKESLKSGVEMKHHWTHEDLHLGFESAGATTFSDEESVDAFVDAYMEPIKDDVVKTKTAKKGLLRELCFLSEKSTFFEIFKCHPVYYSQCFTRKVSEIRDECKVDVSYVEDPSDGTSISLTPGEKGEKTVVIEGQSSDLVIYIQVELEDESRTNSEVSFEYQANSLGTQTAEVNEKSSSERSIKLEENEQERNSLFKLWKRVAETSAPLARSSSFEEKKIPSETLTLVIPEKITVADPEILDIFEVMSEKEIKETQPEEIKSPETMSKMNLIDVMAAKQKAHIWFVQNNLMPVHRGEIRLMTFPPSPMEEVFDSKGTAKEWTEKKYGFELNPKSVELEDAMKLIHEIESDVMEVKLNDALSILPRLETELRKHVEEKLKNMQQTESKTEDEQKKTPTESTKDSKSEASEGRLSSLLAILSSLEDAVKVNDSSTTKPKVCGYDSSTIFQLLHALTDSIRQVEETPTVTNMSKTIDLASRLDVAVRGEESEMKPPVEYFLPVEKPKQEVQEPLAEIISEQNLKTTRKKIFQQVEDEAAVVEDRLERDFERLDRLERENDELLMFLEAFLQKTGRRVSELGDLKDRLKTLSSSLNDVYDTLKSIISLQEEDRKRRSEVEKRIAEVAEIKPEASSPTEGLTTVVRLPLEQSSKGPSSLTPSSLGQSTSILFPSPALSNLEPSTQPSSIEASTAQASPSLSSPPTVTSSSIKPQGSVKWEPIRETVSGLLEALNTLKMKALEKKKFYLDILSKTESATTRERNTESQRSSVTSVAGKQSEQLNAKIKKFKKIDGHSCYMAWTKPKGPLENFIEGYHIYVNGKINHRVRNPERRQAVLYSVDFKHKADIQLYAITEKFPKILLASHTHQND